MIRKEFVAEYWLCWVVIEMDELLHSRVMSEFGRKKKVSTLYGKLKSTILMLLIILVL